MEVFDIFQDCARNDLAKVAEHINTFGVSPDGKNSDGNTPLHTACSVGSLEMVQLLLDSGASVGIRTSNRGYTGLHLTCFAGHLGVIRELVARGANINEFEEVDGYAALHLAALRDNLPLLCELIDLGAFVDISSERGLAGTPLCTAAGNGRLLIVQELLRRGASVNAVIPRTGRTALHCATNSGHLDVVRELLHHSADVHAEMTNGWTALHLAAQKGFGDIITELIDFGADIDHRANGLTALHFACSCGKIPIIELLIGRGARYELDELIAAAAKEPTVRRFLEQSCCSSNYLLK